MFQSDFNGKIWKIHLANSWKHRPPSAWALLRSMSSLCARNSNSKASTSPGRQLKAAWWWRRWRRWGDHPMVQTAWMRNVREIWWDQDPRYAKTKSRWNMVKPTKYCWTWYCILSTRASFILFSIHAWDHLYKGDNQYVDCKFWFPMVSAYQFPIYYIPCITCNYIPSYVLLHPMYYMYYIPCNYIPSYAH